MVTLGAKAQLSNLVLKVIQTNITQEDHITTISWMAMNEVNASYYVIEKQMSDGTYEIIGTKKAQGNGTNTCTAYQFEDYDRQTNTIPMYKITLVWMDGTRLAHQVSASELQLAHN